MDVIVLVAKGAIGGAVVVVFSALGEVVRPRGLAGITSGAPSIAVASLAVTVVASGVIAATDLARGMVAGAFGLVAWCLVGAAAVKRFGALKGSMATTGLWFVTAFSLWAAFLR